MRTITYVILNIFRCLICLFVNLFPKAEALLHMYKFLVVAVEFAAFENSGLKQQGRGEGLPARLSL